MRGIKPFLIGGGVFAASCLLVTAAFAQGNNAPGKAPGNTAGGFQNVHPLPPGGPAPRLSAVAL